MNSLAPEIVTIGLGSAVVLLLALLLMRRIVRRNRVVPEEKAPRAQAGFACPDCGGQMESGYLLLGRGAIWAPRSATPPGGTSHLGMALPNTMSMSPRPALNLAWRCVQCELLLLDHRQLVRPRRGE